VKRTEHDKFVKTNLESMLNDTGYTTKNQEYLEYLLTKNYQFNFSWFGRPIIQMPQDIYAVQQMIWETQPDLVIETGIAHGGSIVLTASLMAQLDFMDSMYASPPNTTEYVVQRQRHVIGVDVDIREHNAEALYSHPLKDYYTLIEGSSIDQDIVDIVRNFSLSYKRVMVLLDSKHTHEHVLSELMEYAPLVTKGCYLVVWDSGLEDLSDEANNTVEKLRPWGRGNNPKTAMLQYLGSLDPKITQYTNDKTLRAKLGISAASDAFLLRTV